MKRLEDMEGGIAKCDCCGETMICTEQPDGGLLCEFCEEAQEDEREED